MIVRETPRASSDRPAETLTKREIAHAAIPFVRASRAVRPRELIDAALEEIVAALALGEE